VKITAEQVGKIKQGHEDAMVDEVKVAAPHVHEKEIRRLVREHGDGNKVLEILTGAAADESQDQTETPLESIPNGIPNKEDSAEPLQDTLAESMETLSLDAHVEQTDSETREVASTVPSLNTVNGPTPKTPKQQHPSVARKQKEAKRAQKEAAKRRKRVQSMGLDKQMVETKDDERVLKAIVI
jgi:hypothetical protein